MHNPTTILLTLLALTTATSVVGSNPEAGALTSDTGVLYLTFFTDKQCKDMENEGLICYNEAFNKSLNIPWSYSLSRDLWAGEQLDFASTVNGNRYAKITETAARGKMRYHQLKSNADCTRVWLVFEHDLSSSLISALGTAPKCHNKYRVFWVVSYISSD